MEKVYFVLGVDCESTQPKVNNPSLGEKAVRGIAEVINKNAGHCTFFVIPGDIKKHKNIYAELLQAGYEIGLHLHPGTHGFNEYCGLYGPEQQETIIIQALDEFCQNFGRKPDAFSMGYASANDYTYPALKKIGFSHGTCSIPGRILPECASIWAGAPLFIHYAHPYNRCLAGNLDFVEIPITVDWESRMWSGKHPLDLRVELVDSKNHSYTIEKSIKRQIEEKVPVKIIRALTHNIFEFDNPENFRRQTLEGMIGDFKNICEKMRYNYEITTCLKVATEFRKLNPV
ncbi:MAG: polysaccharide deacetylase family protein [Candidatus Omnitrophica bacterium]|nr:polysaccharide deacetylase family protein [Candidatus Omnitrophota bacterium]MCM8828226.1 polysaccharide deacetylase family protein [Candidatus Omnitrophota bacterium]